MKDIKVLAIWIVSILCLFGLAGCGSKDVDPTAKIDAPGYYNGPMKAKSGTTGASGATGDPAPAEGTK